MKQKNIQHSAITGGTGNRERVENDFYATPPESTHALFDNYKFPKDKIYLEPCCGKGHISEVIKDRIIDRDDHSLLCSYDLIDYDYFDCDGVDIDAETTNYNILEFDEYHWDICITNPPFKQAESILSNLIEQSKDGNIICLFLKIQFLEGLARRKLFEQHPPKEVLVFSKRQSPYRNGSPVDENGKPWSSAMCFCWFIWEVGFTGKPTIKWI